MFASIAFGEGKAHSTALGLFRVLDRWVASGVAIALDRHQEKIGYKGQEDDGKADKIEHEHESEHDAGNCNSLPVAALSDALP